MFIFFAVIFAAVLLWVLHLHSRRARRDALALKSLPPEWIQVLDRNVSLYRLLPPALRQALYGRINIFLDEKTFVGCDGLEISEEIRLTIAGNACMLLLGRDKRCFPGFTSILVYPDTYVAKEVKYDGLVAINHDVARAGESWHRGPVVLSWADVMRGSLNPGDGHNVVLHEFAHKLDEENAIMNGLPVLRDRSHYAEWAEVLSQEYESLLHRVERGTNSVIDGYGTVSPAEFFAVATESFFDKPVQMQEKLPELYQQLSRFYNLDPAGWRGGG
jgi:MtfA peptidase